MAQEIHADREDPCSATQRSGRGYGGHSQDAGQWACGHHHRAGVGHGDSRGRPRRGEPRRSRSLDRHRPVPRCLRRGGVWPGSGQDPSRLSHGAGIHRLDQRGRCRLHACRPKQRCHDAQSRRSVAGFPCSAGARYAIGSRGNAALSRSTLPREGGRRAHRRLESGGGCAPGMETPDRGRWTRPRPAARPIG